MANRHHRRALRFFWAWLLGATLASLAGNIAHALLTAPTGSRWLAAAVAAVPPTVLLAAVHGVAVLRSRRSRRSTVPLWPRPLPLRQGHSCSAVALRDLAVLAGISPALAAILPVVIDLAVAVATIALVAIGDKPARRRRTATSNASPTATASAAPPGRTATITPDRCAPPMASDATARLAAELVATKHHPPAGRDGRGDADRTPQRRPPQPDRGRPSGCTTAVKRVLQAAEAQRQHFVSA